MSEPTVRFPEPAFDATYVDALGRLGTVRAHPKNTVVFQEGDRSDQLYVVQSGKVKVLGDSDGREIIVDILGPQQYFGEMALDGRPRSASVITLEASKLAIVQRNDFKRFLLSLAQIAHYRHSGESRNPAFIGVSLDPGFRRDDKLVVSQFRNAQ